MSRPAAAMNAGQTNRRFILLAIVLGLIGAILVYVAFSREGGGSGGSGAGSQVPVVVAKTDIAARTTITGSMVEVKLVNVDDASTLAYQDTANVVGKVTRFPIAANEQLLSTKVVALSGNASVASKSLSFVVPTGMRAIAIDIKEVVSAGGLVLPGDYVDILVVYDIEFANPLDPKEREKAESFYVNTIFQDVQVLAVSQAVVDVVQPVGTPEATQAGSGGGHRARNTEGKADPDAITVTLALSPQDAQKLYLAASNGEIRLTVRGYGDDVRQPVDSMTWSDLFPRTLPNPFIR